MQQSVLINDQIRGLFYLYNISAGSDPQLSAAWEPQPPGRPIPILSISSIARRWAADHTDTLYVYNINSGWSTYDLTASGGAQNLAITVPGVGAISPAIPTVAHTWCPSGTVGNNASIQFYPQTDSVNVPTSVLGATTDGQHILGASLSGSSITLDDIGRQYSGHSLCPEAATGCPATNQVRPDSVAALHNPVLNGTVNLTGVTNATAVNQVVTGRRPPRLPYHGRAHRLRHLHHAEHFHYGAPASVLSAPGQRRRPGRLCDLRRRFTSSTPPHRSARRRVLSR